MSEIGELGAMGGMLQPGVPSHGTPSPGNGASVDLLGLLEDRVAQLVARFKEARKTIETLQAQLDASETRAAASADREERLRTELHTRVSRLIDQIRSLESDGPEDDEQ